MLRRVGEKYLRVLKGGHYLREKNPPPLSPLQEPVPPFRLFKNHFPSFYKRGVFQLCTFRHMCRQGQACVRHMVSRCRAKGFSQEKYPIFHQSYLQDQQLSLTGVYSIPAFEPYPHIPQMISLNHMVARFADFIPEKWKYGDIGIACGNVENPGKFG